VNDIFYDGNPGTKFLFYRQERSGKDSGAEKDFFEGVGLEITTRE
jgi:hypothetical protein